PTPTFHDGDPFKVLTSDTRPSPLGSGYYFAKVSCSGCSPTLIEVYSDASLSTRVDGTNPGVGIQRVISDKSLTFASGASTVFPASPVTRTLNGCSWQIETGKIGVRIATEACQAAHSYSLAPIQGIKMPNGTWTAYGQDGYNYMLT